MSLVCISLLSILKYENAIKQSTQGDQLREEDLSQICGNPQLLCNR